MRQQKFKKIVYEACERIETGLSIYACRAMNRVASGYPFVNCWATMKMAEFYGKPLRENWFPEYDRYSEEVSHARIMLMLIFLEGMRDENNCN